MLWISVLFISILLFKIFFILLNKVIATSRTTWDWVSKIISHRVNLLIMCGVRLGYLSKVSIAVISLRIFKGIDAHHTSARSIIQSWFSCVSGYHHSITSFLLALINLCHTVINICIIITQIWVAAKLRKSTFIWLLIVNSWLFLAHLYFFILKIKFNAFDDRLI